MAESDVLDPSRHFGTVNCRTAKGLFDHAVGAAEQSRWHGETQCTGGLEIDHQLEFCGLLDWQVGRLGACKIFCIFQDP